jgi:superfamily II DNA or RNA helicase
MTLRDYQTRCLNAIREGWKQWRTQFVVSATGTGKTEIFARLAGEEVSNSGRVLIVADTEELVTQSIAKVHRSTGIKPGMEKAESQASLHDKIVVASIQTISRPNRLSVWPKDHFTLIIIDEADKGIAPSYKTILDHFSTARVCGFSANADRGDKRNISEVFENIAFEYNLADAVRDGWLVRPVVETVPVKIDMKGITSRRTKEGSDYDETEVNNRLEPLIPAMCDVLVKKIGDRRTLVYLTSIHLCKIAAEAVNRLGVRAQYVTGVCDDRTEKVAAIGTDSVQVTFNCSLLSRGFDEDSIRCISVWRPTKIRSVLLQAVGRATRPLRSIVDRLNAEPSFTARQQIIRESGKDDALILDFLWLTDTLSLVRPTDLVISNSQIAEHAKTMQQQGDLLNLAEEAGRDYLKALAKRMKEVANRPARVIDPLVFAVQVKDTSIGAYEPSSRWEMNQVSSEQAKLLTQLGIDTSKVTSKGYASKLITYLLARRKAGMASVQQMSFLGRLGVHDTEKLTYKEAKTRIDARLAELKSRSPQAKKQEPQLELTSAARRAPQSLEI